MKVRTILFVDQSPNGELARRMREKLRSLEETLGFRVKVVERVGQQLGSKFSLTTVWEGTKCGRTDCVTCEQGVEELPPCTMKNVLYENICVECNPGGSSKGELERPREDIPTIYVGETSRSLFERAKEHWAGMKGGATKNHMIKHVTLEHDGREPKFVLKLIRQFKSALARQVAEAVRIRRRGGEGGILNSKGEFNRCHIPRLRVEEVDTENLELADKEVREQEMITLREQDDEWERKRVRELGKNALMGPTTSPMKRSQGDSLKGEQDMTRGRKRRKLKFQKLEDNWGDVELEDKRDHREQLELPPTGSNVPKEGSLRQTSIKELLCQEQPTCVKPADRPNLQDQADHGRDRDTTNNPVDQGSETEFRQNLEAVVLKSPTIRRLGKYHRGGVGRLIVILYMGMMIGLATRMGLETWMTL